MWYDVRKSSVVCTFAILQCRSYVTPRRVSATTILRIQRRLTTPPPRNACFTRGLLKGSFSAATVLHTVYQLARAGRSWHCTAVRFSATLMHHLHLQPMATATLAFGELFVFLYVPFHSLRTFVCCGCHSTAGRTHCSSLICVARIASLKEATPSVASRLVIVYRSYFGGVPASGRYLFMRVIPQSNNAQIYFNVFFVVVDVIPQPPAPSIQPLF